MRKLEALAPRFTGDLLDTATNGRMVSRAGRGWVPLGERGKDSRVEMLPAMTDLRFGPVRYTYPDIAALVDRLAKLEVGV